MIRKIFPIFAALLPLAFTSSADAATVYALFTGQTQTSSGSNAAGFTTNISANTFPVAPTLARTGTSFTTNGNGGASAYTDFNGYIWNGNGGTTSVGRSFGWINGSTNNSLTFTVNTVGLTDLTVAMSIRSFAEAGTTVKSFSAIEYSLDGTNYFNAASGSALNFPTETGAFENFTLNLSSISQIYDVSSLRLRFTVPTIPAIVEDPSNPGSYLQNNTSVRIDNVLFTAQAIPEPSTGALALAAGLILFRRKRSV